MSSRCMKRIISVALAILVALSLMVQPVSAATAKVKFIRNNTMSSMVNYHIGGDVVVINKSATGNQWIGNVKTGKLVKLTYNKVACSSGNPLGGGLAAVTNNKKTKYDYYGETKEEITYGYVNTSSKEVYEDKFTYASGFKNGKAMVSWPEDGKYYSALINNTGSYLVTVEGRCYNFGPKHVSFKLDDNNYIIYKHDGTFVAITDVREAEACVLPSYSHTQYQKFVAAHTSYKNISFVGYGKYIAQKNSYTYLMTSAGKVVKKFAKNLTVIPTLMNDGKNVYLRLWKDFEHQGAAKLSGKIFIPVKYSGLSLTAGDTFFGTTGSRDQNQYILNFSGNVVYSKSGTMLVTNTSGENPIFGYDLGEVAPRSGDYLFYFNSKVKDISTANLKKIKSKVNRKPTNSDARMNVVEEYNFAMGIAGKSSASCLEVWMAEVILSGYVR